MAFFSGIWHLFSVIATEVHNGEMFILRNKIQIDQGFQIAEGIEREIPGIAGTIPYMLTLAAHGAFGIIAAEIKKHNASGVQLITNPDGTVTLSSGLTLAQTVFQEISDLIPIFEQHPSLSSLGSVNQPNAVVPAAQSSIIPTYVIHK